MKKIYFTILSALLLGLSMTFAPAAASGALAPEIHRETAQQDHAAPAANPILWKPPLEAAAFPHDPSKLDFSLAPAASISFEPQILETTLISGASASLPLTLTNSGAETVLFELQDDLGGWKSDLLPLRNRVSLHPVSDETEPRHAPGMGGRGAPLRASFPDTLLLNESFEGGVVPPGNWSELVTNRQYNWEIASYGTPHTGDFAANVEYDDKAQDEWLLSPPLELSQGVLSFWSEGSVYYCRDLYNYCDMKVWIVVGNVGGGDDVYLGKADDSWSASWIWAQTTFDLTPLLPGGAVRIGFEYVGNDGAQIMLDDITLDGLKDYTDIPWLTESPLSGTIPASQRQVVNVTFDASQVSQSGLYTGTLHILSSDSLNPDLAVPMKMHVIDYPAPTLAAPNHGPASGGTQVTLSGSQFKTGAAVLFGGVAASDVEVVSSAEISCVTPAHAPGTVDIRVTNTDTLSGTLTSGFTYETVIAQMSIPSAGGAQHATVQVPVNLADVAGLGAASFTVSFDNAVIHAAGAHTGGLAPGWSLVANTGTPGQIRISMASPGGTASGAGVLAWIDFEVVGAPGSSSELVPSSILLNDGAIPVQAASGSFSVDPVFAVAGLIQFWKGTPVSDTVMTLDGASDYFIKSSPDGAYHIDEIPAGDYTLTPGKTNEVNGISAYDASLALQHDAGLITLVGSAKTAADVNKNGLVSSMDAFYILQKSVNLISLPFPGAGGIWSFSPLSRTYPGLDSNQTGQDFQAVLLGDPSGSWAPESAQNAAMKINIPEAVSATLALPTVSVLPGEVFTVPLSLDLNAGQLFGADIEIAYGTNVLTSVQVLPGALAGGWSLASNTNTPGLIRLAMAGATPITADGILINLKFSAASQPGLGTDLSLTKGLLNEGQLSSALVSGHVTIATPVQANFSASPLSGPAPLSVTFTNLSSGDFTSSLWSFGDGSTSTAAAPSHNYTAIGTYTVTLTVSGVGGSQSLVKSSYIRANGLKVTGRAQYWSGGAGLAGVAMKLNGGTSYQSSTISTGVYTISNVLAGSYTLTPEKTDQVNGITAYDASLVLQHIAGLSNLTGNAAAAADVNNSGSIGTMDASYILQKAVGLIDVPFPGSTFAWEFNPATRSYTNMNTDKTGQDFVGILLGDPSGSWLPGGLQVTGSAAEAQATLTVQSAPPDPSGQVTVTLLLDTAGADASSLDLKLGYDPLQAQSLSVQAGSMLSGWLFVNNEPVVGEIWIGLANAQPVSGAGIVVSLVFQMNQTGGFSPLHLIEGLVNEGSLPVKLVDGQMGGFSLYLPVAKS